LEGGVASAASLSLFLSITTMTPPFAVNEKVTLAFEKKYVCRYGEFVFKLEQIKVPAYGQTLTVRDIIKWKDHFTGVEAYGVRFHELFNPKFPTWVPALGEDKLIPLEPLFDASDFKKVN
jgi:hypothetical protein